MYKDRKEAGRQLAKKLEQYRGTTTVVLALPRGGIVIGYEIARILSLPIDIVTIRKVGHPSNSEYAIGAVDENGIALFNEIEIASVDKQWLKEETKKQKEEAKRRTILYRKGKKRLDLARKIAIIVDDGIATGFTMRLAVKVIKRENPEKIVIAVPVASFESIRDLKAEGSDEIIVLEKPENFMGAVGAHYREFEPVDDEEVIRLLNS